MEQVRVGAALITGFIGLSMLVGFFYSYRDRLYLGLLGLSFLTLAGEILVPISQGVVPPPPLLWLKRGLLALAAALFVAAAAIAVAQTRQQVHLIHERRQGLEREMWEYLGQLKRKDAEKRAEEPGESAESTAQNAKDAEGER